MTNWRSRTAVNTTWKTHDRVSLTSWDKRNTNDTVWGQDRVKHMTNSRNYMLGSFFTQLLTAIIDPKDDYAIRIKTDPAYEINSADYNTRHQHQVIWKNARI